MSENCIISVNSIKFPGTDEEEVVEFVTEGKIYERSGTVFLVYEESELSGLEGCTTTLKLSGDKVSMIRFGSNNEMNARMDFNAEKPYSGYYGTPYGAIEFGIETNKIINRVNTEEGGFLSIDYNMNLVGLSEGRNILSMRVFKRGDEQS